MSDTSGTPTTNSGLILPGDGGFKDPNAKGRAKKKDVQPQEEIELYPSEYNAVRTLAADIQRKYDGKAFTESSTQQFENEVVDRFANEVGIVARVYWKDATVSDEPTDDRVYFLPTIAMIGRTESRSIDHERMAKEVQSGELDGRQGTIRPDGTFGDPTKTTIR